MFERLYGIVNAPNIYKIKYNVILIFIFWGIYLMLDQDELYFRNREYNPSSKIDLITDRFLYSVATQSTIGYGHVVPYTVRAKLLTCVQAFTTMFVILLDLP